MKAKTKMRPMPPFKRSATLGVFLAVEPGRELRIGSLVRHEEGTVFEVSDSYIALGVQRPLVSLAWTGRDENETLARLTNPNDKTMRGTHLPAFFDNLLPEGALRTLVERELGPGAFDNFDVLARLGEDLPGAIVVRLEAGTAGRTRPRRPALTVPPSTEASIGFSLAGVQLKFSMTLDQQTLTVPARHGVGEIILKTPSRKHPFLPEAEYTGLVLAQAAGVSAVRPVLVSNHRIRGIPAEFLEGGQSLAVPRFDREPGGRRVQTEDFSQILGAIGEQKYFKANETTIINVVHRFSDDPISGLLEAVRRITVNLLLGNGDAHLKNWSFLYSQKGKVQLTPAYDLVPTFLYGDDTMALEFGNTKTPYNIGLRRFERAAGAVHVDAKVVMDEVRRTVRQALAVWPDLLKTMPLSADGRLRLLERLPRLRLVQEISPDFRVTLSPDPETREHPVI